MDDEEAPRVEEWTTPGGIQVSIQLKPGQSRLTSRERKKHEQFAEKIGLPVLARQKENQEQEAARRAEVREGLTVVQGERGGGPAPPPSLASLDECMVCGAAVLNAALHLKWHQQQS